MPRKLPDGLRQYLLLATPSILNRLLWDFSGAASHASDLFQGDDMPVRSSLGDPHDGEVVVLRNTRPGGISAPQPLHGIRIVLLGRLSKPIDGNFELSVRREELTDVSLCDWITSIRAQQLRLVLLIERNGHLGQHIFPSQNGTTLGIVCDPRYDAIGDTPPPSTSTAFGDDDGGCQADGPHDMTVTR